MALPIVRIPRLQQSIPVVDAQGRQTSEFKHRLDDIFGSISDAFMQIQGALDGIQMLVDQLAAAVIQIQTAQTTAESALDDSATAQGSANAAQSTANTALANAATAQTRADNAYTLAGNAVPKDAGPAWSAATGTASRATFDTTTVLLPDLAQRVKAIVDDLQANGALT